MKKLLLFTFLLLTFCFSKAQIHIGPSQTYANIQAACPFIQPGDTVYIHAGTYAAYQYYANLQGTPNAWITIKRYANDAHVIKGGWQFSNLRYVKFEKLFFQADVTLNSTLMNIDNNGDCSTQQSKHIIIDSCQFWDVSNSNSLKFGGVDSAEVVNCIFKNNPGPGAGLALNVCHYIWAHKNYFEDIAGKAIQTKLGTRFVTIEKNFIKNCGTIDAALKIGEAGGLNFHCIGDNWLARDIKVYANVIIGGRASFSVGQASDCEFVNNTFVNPTNFVTRILADDPTFPCSLIVVKNNIFYLTQSIYFNGSSPTNNNIQYNTHLYQNNIFYHTTNPSWLGPDPVTGPYDAEEILGTQFVNNIVADPLFVNVNADNVHLTSLSPAIASGMNVTSPTVDYYGASYFSPRSIGASEFNISSFTTSFTNDTPTLFIFPNPTHEKLTVISRQGTVKILDAFGAIVKEAEISGPSATLDVSMLANGIYFIQVLTSKGISMQKMIVQHN